MTCVVPVLTRHGCQVVNLAGVDINNMYFYKDVNKNKYAIAIIGVGPCRGLKGRIVGLTAD